MKEREMIGRCDCCGKPIYESREAISCDNAISYRDASMVKKLTYCMRCFDHNLEPLWLWINYIDSVGGIKSVPKYQRTIQAWTGSHVNGTPLNWKEIQEHYLRIKKKTA